MADAGEHDETAVSEEHGLTTGHGSARRYWSIHPGRAAEEWGSFQEQCLIGVSWGLKHDLREIAPSSQHALRDWLVETQGLDRATAAIRASQLWSFYYEMQPGDLVCATGQNQLLGLGEVVGDYEFALSM